MNLYNLFQPHTTRLTEGKVKELVIDLDELTDAEFEQKYQMTKAEARAELHVTESALNPADPKGDYQVKQKALHDLSRTPGVDQKVVQQRRLDLEKEAKTKGVAEGSLNEFAPGGSGASSYYAVTENFVNDFIEQKEEELQDRINSGFSKEEIADMKQEFASDMVYFEQVRDGFLKGMKPGFEAYRQGDTMLKDQLGEYWLENNLPLNQDWEKIYGEPWGDDTGFNEGVAEGFNGISVDIEPELDYDVVYVDINGKKYNFNYWYADEKPTNELEFRKDIPEYLKREEWYNKLDFPTKMEVLHAVVQAELGNEPSEYKPTVGDEPLDEIDRRGFLKGLGAAAATAAVPALAQAGSGIDYNKVQMLHDQMFKKNPQYAKEWQAANGARVRAEIKSKNPRFRDRATARKARLDMTAKILQKYGVKDLKEGLYPGEYYVHTVHFADGTTGKIKTPNDEYTDEKIKAFYAKKGKDVAKVDYNWGVQGERTDISESRAIKRAAIKEILSRNS